MTLPRKLLYGRHVLDATLDENDDRQALRGDVHRSDLIRALKDVIDYWIAHAADTYQVDELTAGELLDLLSVEAGLSDQQRRVLELRLDGRSWRQVASALDLSVWTVRGHVDAAIARLRSLYTAEAV